jgi:putative membrane protein
MAETEHPPVELKSAPLLVVKGFCMGVAEIIPGVSGGTVALVLGVYQRFIDSIRSYHPASVLNLLQALPNAEKRPGALRAVHLDFLIPLLIGMAMAIVSLSGVMKGLLADYPAHMNGLFFGMILASVYVPPSRMTERKPLHLAIAFLGFAGAATVVGLPFVETGGGLGTLFLLGSVAICAMVLPGVSGSYLLKVLGQYERVIGAIHDRDLLTVAVFAAGCLVGITSFVRVLSVLLRRFPNAMMSALTGMMLGSLRAVWPFRATSPEGQTSLLMPEVGVDAIAPVFGLMFAGFVVVAVLIVLDHKLGGEKSE